MTAVTAHDVVDDREAKPGAAELPGARRVDLEETLGHPRQMLAGDPRLAILDHDPHRRPAAEGGSLRTMRSEALTESCP